MKENTNTNKNLYFAEGIFEMPAKDTDIFSAIWDDVNSLEGVYIGPLLDSDRVYTHVCELEISHKHEISYGVICKPFVDSDGDTRYEVVDWDYTLLPFDIYLTQEAYICGYVGAFFNDVDNNGNELPTGVYDYWYTATAADYTNKKYQVFWTILPDFDIHHSEDESEACDWDRPYMILDEDGRNVVDFVRDIRC